MGLVKYKAQCYKFSSERKSWNASRINCQNIPGYFDLVIMDNSELWMYLRKCRDCWIGLSDEGSDGTFKWVNGDSLKFGSVYGQDPWHSGEPNVRQYVSSGNITTYF